MLAHKVETLPLEYGAIVPMRYMNDDGCEHRSLWTGHVVRDGSRTTAHYESDDPDMLADVALATDWVIALIRQHCRRPLFAVDKGGLAGNRGEVDSRAAS